MLHAYNWLSLFEKIKYFWEEGVIDITYDCCQTGFQIFFKRTGKLDWHAVTPLLNSLDNPNMIVGKEAVRTLRAYGTSDIIGFEGYEAIQKFLCGEPTGYYCEIYEDNEGPMHGPLTEEDTTFLDDILGV